MLFLGSLAKHAHRRIDSFQRSADPHKIIVNVTMGLGDELAERSVDEEQRTVRVTVRVKEPAGPRDLLVSRSRRRLTQEVARGSRCSRPDGKVCASRLYAVRVDARALELGGQLRAGHPLETRDALGDGRCVAKSPPSPPGQRLDDEERRADRRFTAIGSSCCRVHLAEG